MKLEDQIVSPGLSRHLKDLGVKQESLFYWATRMNGDIEECVPLPVDMIDNYYTTGFGWVTISAFTVAELGELMKGRGMGTTAFSTMIKREWWVAGGKWNVEEQKYEMLICDENEANVRAKMLIYLITQGYLIEQQTMRKDDRDILIGEK